MISVVIPMYNAYETILDTITSVINQSYVEMIEILVVNDGSTDGCEKLVESLVDKKVENRIIKIINKQNGGVSSARNVGIKESSGEWIALIDSDDIWYQDKLSKQLSEITMNPDIKFIGSNRNRELYPFFKKSQKHIYKLSTKEIIWKWYPHTSTALIKKDLLFKAGLYDETRSHAEDGDLWLKLSGLIKIYVLNEDLVYTGGGKLSFGVSGLSANMPKMYQGEILAIKGARKRGQISLLESIFFHGWLTLKYLRRLYIVKIKGKK
jgi:glycosyltransferase involved in cell wall biosynthesis